MERSHLNVQREFYQMLDYGGGVDLRQKFGQWADYYNYLRPHSAQADKTPYELLKLRMLGSSSIISA